MTSVKQWNRPLLCQLTTPSRRPLSQRCRHGDTGLVAPSGALLLTRSQRLQLHHRCGIALLHASIIAHFRNLSITLSHAMDLLCIARTRGGAPLSTLGLGSALTPGPSPVATGEGGWARELENEPRRPTRPQVPFPARGLGAPKRADALHPCPPRVQRGRPSWSKGQGGPR